MPPRNGFGCGRRARPGFFFIRLAPVEGWFPRDCIRGVEGGCCEWAGFCFAGVVLAGWGGGRGKKKPGRGAPVFGWVLRIGLEVDSHAKQVLNAVPGFVLAVEADAFVVETHAAAEVVVDAQGNLG